MSLPKNSVPLPQMPRKGMRTIFFKSASPSHSPPPHHRRTFSESLMEEKIEAAQSEISKFDDSSMFSNNRVEAKQYLNSVKELQIGMQFLANENPNSKILVRAQSVMETAMKRIQREFYQTLSSNRDYLDPESVSNRSSRTSPRSSVSDFEDVFEDEIRVADESISEAVMADLKEIADCMIFSGYGKECVKIYTIIRKSIVDECLYRLGVERFQFSVIQKMDWQILEVKIKNWLNTIRFAVQTLFCGERILCDHVFSASDSIRSSCFAEISREGAMNLFGFPEMVGNCKKTPEKIFRTLDIYEAISNLWPEIEAIFSFESTSAVRSQAVTALLKLGESVRSMLTDFETAVQHYASKTPLHGGGIHPLNRYVMNYIQFLSDYSESLADIVIDWPLTKQSSLPESYFENTESPISVEFAWLILVLLCKIDARAELFKDVSLSYLFLANNLQYIITKVRKSNLRYLLGEEWIAKHEVKLKQYAMNFERMGWSKVFASLPENPTADLSPAEANERFRAFNLAFEEAYRKQSSWIVPDSKLRDEIRISLAAKLGPGYRAFYMKNRVKINEEMGADSFIRYAPDDLGNYLSDIFYGMGTPAAGSVSSVSTKSSVSSPSHARMWSVHGGQ